MNRFKETSCPENTAVSSAASCGLTSEEFKRYQSDGYLVRKSVFSVAEVLLLQAAAERAVDKAGLLSEHGHTYILDNKRFVDAGYTTIQFEHATGSETIRVIEPVHELEPALEELIDEVRITEPIRNILGRRDIALWTAKLNLKRPRQGSGFNWHQDSPYWVHDSNHVDLLPNVMITFDDTNEDNGCLRIIRASHKQGCLAGTSDGSQLGGFFTSPECFDLADQVKMAAPAGSLIFFSPHSIHGSMPNTSDEPRRAIILTYQPANFPALKSKVVRNIAPGDHAGTDLD
jgi:ectoine hydroxylase-related dioxygenase (phytanoyl-CoA dioxygenase family)